MPDVKSLIRIVTTTAVTGVLTLAGAATIVTLAKRKKRKQEEPRVFKRGDVALLDKSKVHITHRTDEKPYEYLVHTERGLPIPHLINGKDLKPLK